MPTQLELEALHRQESSEHNAKILETKVTRGKADIFDGKIPAGQLPTPTPPLFSEVVEVNAVSGNNDLTQYDGKIVKLAGIDIVSGTLTLTLPTNIQVYFTMIDEEISAMNFIVGTQYNSFPSHWFRDGDFFYTYVGENSSGRIDFGSIPPHFTNNLVVKIGGSINVYSSQEI